MKKILFFDADDIFKNFIQNHPLTDFNYDIFEESLNTIDINKISSYNDIEVISLFVHSEMIDTNKLNLFPNLKMIATRSTGFNHIDLNYCQKRHITVCNVPRYGEATVAEFAFGVLLALSRKIIQGRNAMAHNHISIDQYIGFDLQGKTIGIIGTGSIGQHMIQIAQGFGMNIIAFDKYPNDKLKQFYVNQLDDLYKNADIISLHIPSTPQNFHLINEDAFNKMKKGVIIINTARGDLIDTQALYFALCQGIVGGAGLDVLENEDFLLHDEVITTNRIHDNAFLLDSAMNLKLLQFKNVIATPHIAFNSIDAINRINQTTLDNIKNFKNGTIINNIL
ncbi:MAG: hydroxyacid dehydrogenase [Alphaproteobacteria bacterium]|nr:hydroxyacid dehydrogenase [Alphaproteobacteria bacterium]